MGLNRAQGEQPPSKSQPRPSYRALYSARIRSTLSKSTSTDVHTDAASVCDALSVSARIRRILLSGTTSSRPSVPAFDTRAAAAVGAAPRPVHRRLPERRP